MIEQAQLTKLIDSRRETEWRDLLFALARDLGFDFVLYGTVESKLSSFATPFLHSNYSKKWRSIYDANKLYYVDPVVLHCLNSRVPIVWDQESFKADNECELYEQASGFGIRAGITFPIHGPNGEFGLISFAADVRPGKKFNAHLQHCRAYLSLVRDYAFESSFKYTSARESLKTWPRLSKHELEVIKWVMAGKSSWEIAQIIHRAEATVNFHIGQIFRKFNVNTRQQAVIKAIRLGIITPDNLHD